MLVGTFFCKFCSVSNPCDPPPTFAAIFLEMTFGRAVQCQIFSQRIPSGGDKKIPSMFFVHSLGLSPQYTAHLVNKIREVSQECECQPDEHSMILMGDFHLAPEGSAKIFLLDASSLSNAPSLPHLAPSPVNGIDCFGA